jgi:hypothetical protein
VSLEGCTFLDRSGIRALARVAQRGARRLAFVAPLRSRARRALDAADVASEAVVCDSLDAALRSLAMPAPTVALA